MKELNIVSQQTASIITWNYEDLKRDLKEEIAKYDNIVYNEDNIVEAKSDVAELKSLIKKVNDARKAFKEKCMESYEPVDKESKELISIIETPIEKISKNIIDYEKKRVEAKKVEIKEYFDSKLPDGLIAYQKQIYNDLYNDKWENSSSTKKAYKDTINSRIEMISHDLETIKVLNSENESDLLNIYFISFDISKVIQKNNELVEQLKKFREKESARIEAETRAKIEAETRAKIEAEEKAKVEAEKELKAKRLREEILEKEKIAAVITFPIKKEETCSTFLFGEIDDGCGDSFDNVESTICSKTEPLIMKTYELPVTWEMYGTIIMEATSLEEARNKFNRMSDEIDLPYNKSYVDSSFRLTSDDLDELEIITKI